MNIWNDSKWYLFSCLGIYLLLSAITIGALGDCSLRHTMFFLLEAILTVYGTVLFRSRFTYISVLLLGIIPALSLLAIRMNTHVGLKMWEAATFSAFVFSVMQLGLVLVASVPVRWKQWLALLLYGILNVPVVLLWGYYCAEHGWMNAMGGVALLQTNFAETMEYISSRFSAEMVLVVILLSGLGGMLFSRAKQLDWQPWCGKRYYFAVVLFVLLNVVLLYRTHDNIVYQIYRETREFAEQYEDFNKNVQKRREKMRKAVHILREGQPGIYVLVIGESANRNHMSAYGYSLETTPWLSSLKEDPRLLLFSNAYSCHLFTVPTLSYALTAKNQYNTIDLEDAVSLIEVANAAGYETAWISNQIRYSVWNTPYSVIADASNQQFWMNEHVGEVTVTDKYDMAVVDAIDSLAVSEKMLVVFHLMGSHMSYLERYPKEFDRFHTLGRHPQYDEYDNSILYNDYVMQKLVEKVSALPNFQSLLYFSDHSVLVDKGNAAGFGDFDYERTHIPFYIYVSEAFQKNRQETCKNLRAVRGDIITDDLVFDAMLGLMDVRLEDSYEPENDITNVQYNTEPSRFVTLYGEYAITDDPMWIKRGR